MGPKRKQEDGRLFAVAPIGNRLYRRLAIGAFVNSPVALRL